MGQKRIYFSTIALLTLLMFASGSGILYAQRTKSSTRAGEQRKAEKGLKDNRYYFYFINTSITNFGEEEDKNLLREAILRDMISRMLYMRFQFHESYTEIRKAQKLLIDVYRKTLVRDIGEARLLLNSIVPSVFEIDDRDALLYLRLGYRDLNVAKIYLGMGDNIRVNLYSMRLNKYVEAMKTAKHGIRYGLLGRISIEEKKLPARQYGSPAGALLDATIALQDAFDEYDWKNVTFNTIKSKIVKLTANEEKEKLLTLHYDSYFKTRQDVSFFDEIWDKADVNSIEDYQKYKATLD